MKCSEGIKDLIKQWEGLRLQAYRCPSGVLTIGYGHTGADVRPGMKISRERADELLDGDLDYFERGVEGLFAGVPLTQNRFDALVSFAFNVGLGALRNSTLARKVKADPADATIAAEFKRWNKGGGKILPGLVRRREAEAKWYFATQRAPGVAGSLAVLLVLLVTLCGCGRQTMPVAVPVPVESRDSVRVSYREWVRFDTVTVTVALPEAYAERIGMDSASYLETECAESKAWLDADGRLNHWLKNKPWRRDEPVQVPLRTVQTDSVRERRIAVSVPYPVPVSVERNFSAWERVCLKGFVPVTVALIVCMGFIFKRIIRR